MKKILFLALFIFGFSAKGQIQVKFNNRTDKAIQLRITYGESTSPLESFMEVYTQTVASNSISPKYIKIREIKKNRKIYVTGTVAGLGNFKFEERVITQRNQKIDITFL